MAITSFFVILISMALIDAVWLGTMFTRLYEPHIGHLLRNSFEIAPAVIFYLLFSFALNVFVVLPAIRNNTEMLDLLLMGLLFGAVTYGTYDLTNQTVLKNWPWVVTIADIAWGGFLTAATSLIATYVTRYFW
ncbi:MAG TPA: DUF2177 family protein [Parachlamydiaceae bacterium]|nr:DUF2177 family protein [Parachlamydiaceae bacterium]